MEEDEDIKKVKKVKKRKIMRNIVSKIFSMKLKG